VKNRIAIWSSAGFIVGVFWAIYFAMLSKDVPIQPIIYTLARISCPLAFVGDYFHFGVKLSWVLVSNIGVYALLGLIAETLRRQIKPAA
jgi:hypothetical protein